MKPHPPDLEEEEEEEDGKPDKAPDTQVGGGVEEGSSEEDGDDEDRGQVGGHFINPLHVVGEQVDHLEEGVVVKRSVLKSEKK